MSENSKKFFYQFLGGIFGGVLGIIISFLLATSDGMINGIVVLFFGLAGLGAGIPLGIIFGGNLYKNKKKK